MSYLRFTKEQLLNALEARRPWAEKYDADRLAEHQKAEKAFLAEFKAACREAAKWDYATAKEHRFEPFGKKHWDHPTCPRSMVASLDEHLNIIRATGQKSFMVSPRGEWSRLHHLLTHDETIETEMC